MNFGTSYFKHARMGNMQGVEEEAAEAYYNMCPKPNPENDEADCPL